VAPAEDADRQSTWIVIAAMNEAEVIGGVVGELRDEGWPVVVVDDGSRDNTADRARNAGARVVRHIVNLGQGAALQTGIDYAIRRGARKLVTFDADGQMLASDLPAMVAALDSADIALGSRFLGTVEGATAQRMMLLRGSVVMSNWLSGLALTDAHCGFRAFRATAAPHLRILQDRMAHASELLRKIKLANLRVVEVPVTIRYTERSMRKGQTGFQAIRILFDYFFRSA
jgi:glycosyltransferase involved in cell wall biosynthesis